MRVETAKAQSSDSVSWESFAESVQHFFRVIFGFNLAEDLFDFSLLVDQESHAVIAHVRPAREFLLAVSPCNE